MKRIISFCLATFTLASCGNSGEGKGSEPPADNAAATENKLSQLSWILGAWKKETPEGIFTEHWTKENDSFYSGHGALVSAKGDTLFSERIKLEQSGNTLYYKPIVSAQNDGKETVFTEKTMTAEEIVFENPAHDFPQRIIYKKSSDSTLYARIEGKANGKEMKEEYEYKRATNP